MDAEQRLRAMRGNFGIGPAESDAVLAGADALALLREGPGQSQYDACMSCAASPLDEHAPDCWFTKRAALLTRAGRA